jgi:hypothetical protein
MVKTQPLPVSHSGRVFTIKQARFIVNLERKARSETVLNILLSQKGKFLHWVKTLPLMDPNPLSSLVP